MTLGGKGLIFVDGKEWRDSKKILSKVFNYNFVLTQIPELVRMCNKIFDLHETKAQQADPNDLKVKLFDVTTDIISSVLLSSFMGMETSSELIQNKPIAKLTLEVGDESVIISMKEPLTYFLGLRYAKLGLTHATR